MRTYIANSIVSVNVKVGKTSRNIMFRQLSGKGSVYTTDDPKEIDALEAHKWFGSVFHLAKVTNEVTPAPKSTIEEEEDSAVELEAVLVSSCVEAKDFLASRGIDCTSVRSKDAIKKLGEENGLQFVGI